MTKHDVDIQRLEIEHVNPG